jgi:hypothetical protein
MIVSTEREREREKEREGVVGVFVACCICLKVGIRGLLWRWLDVGFNRRSQSVGLTSLSIIDTDLAVGISIALLNERPVFVQRELSVGCQDEPIKRSQYLIIRP